MFEVNIIANSSDGSMKFVGVKKREKTVPLRLIVG